jgi:SOS-response transcriptional repressor LexA
LGQTLADLAEAVGCSKAYLSAIENDRLDNPPRRPLLEQLEAALGLEGGLLVRAANWQRTPAEVRADYERLAADHQSITRLLKAVSRRSDGALNLDALHDSGRLRQLVDRADGNTSPLGPIRYDVPLINKVAAGYPTDFTDLDYPTRVADEYVPCPGLSDPQAFAARVVGESMMPEYREGDTIVFSPQLDPTEGSDCFVRLLPDHHTTFKRIFFESDDQVRLQPLNPAFAPQVVALEQVSGLYPAVLRIQAIQSDRNAHRS